MGTVDFCKIPAAPLSTFDEKIQTQERPGYQWRFINYFLDGRCLRSYGGCEGAGKSR